MMQMFGLALIPDEKEMENPVTVVLNWQKAMLK
jgi:hypothetical protein